MTKCQITCKSLQKSFKCQNFLRAWHLVIFRANQLKKPPCMRGKSRSLLLMFNFVNISRPFQVHLYLPPSSHLWVFIHLHLPSTSTRGLIRANGNHWTENTSLREWLPDKGRKHTCAVLTMRDSMKCRNKVAWRVSRPCERDQEYRLTFKSPFKVKPKEHGRGESSFLAKLRKR